MGKYQRIQKLCKEQGTSVAKMERDLKFARGSVAKIDSHKPSIDRVSKICNYLNVSPMVLLLDEDSSEKELQEAKEIQNVMSEMPFVQSETPIPEAGAGNGRCNDAYGTSDDFSTVRICGDSMEPSLKDGDIVKVFYTTDVDPSDFAMIQINGDEVICKHIKPVQNGIIIHSENPAYEDKFYSVSDVLTLPIRIIGKAVEIVSRKL